MRQHFCAACGSTDQLHQHHLIPRVLGGPDTQDNLITLCHLCHDKMHRLQEKGLLNIETLAEVGRWLALAEGRTVHQGGTNLYSETQAAEAQSHAETLRPLVEDYLATCTQQTRPTIAKLAKYLTERGVKNRLGNDVWAPGQAYDLISKLQIDWLAVKRANAHQRKEVSRKYNEETSKLATERAQAAVALVKPHILEYQRIVGKYPPYLWVASKLNELQKADSAATAWTAASVARALVRAGEYPTSTS